jgi:hypothetical protein
MGRCMLIIRAGCKKGSFAAGYGNRGVGKVAKSKGNP